MARYSSNIPHFEPVIIEGYENFKDYYASCEMQTKEWLLENLTSNSVFIDVGANVGILTLTAGKVIGEKGLIVSIEPTNTFKILEKNLKRAENRHDTPTITVNVAISNKSEKKKDSLYKIWGNSPVSEIWDFKTLDDLVIELGCDQVDVIKIDTDGFELEILEGASKLINQYYPQVIVEVNEALQTRGVTPDQVFDFFIDHRYTDVLLVDDYNYVFTSTWQIGDPWPNCLRLSRWRKKSAIALQKGQLINTPFKLSPATNTVKIEKSHTYKTSGQLGKWNYIINITTQGTLESGPLIIEILGTLREGKISAVIIDDDYQTLLSNEDKAIVPGRFKLTLAAEMWKNMAVIRSFDDASFDFEIDDIHFYHGKSSEGTAKGKFDRFSSKIDRFEKKEELFNYLELSTNFNIRGENSLAHHQGWLMEQSSNHLLIDMAKAMEKAKVLEIGTWEGFTSATLLKNTDASIWTIDPDLFIDESVYPSRYETLSGENKKEVGWLYKTMDFLYRVHQIHANSIDYNWQELEDGFFDIIFIDGDHSESSVKSDTFNSISKLRKGGVMIWDDFNYEGEAVSEAEEGVDDFIINNIDWLIGNFNLASLKGTQFLIGKKI